MYLSSFKSLLLLVSCFGYSAAQVVTIQLPDGQVTGRSTSTVTNKNFFSFQGIPYAQPPVGNLRFQAPQPLQPWANAIDATTEKSSCYQVGTDTGHDSEDCLFINVYTPQISSDNPLPVMFFIYGGGFLTGSSESANYGPDHFMEHDVILVTINYRIGPFGFASTGDSAIPGNAGLKDQNMALQWVQKNIKYFGGDPAKVTIFGQSAGAASVAYHIISPKSAGLFRAAICESGSAISAWAYQRDQVELTQQVATLIDSGFSGNSAQLLQYLQSVPASSIHTASNNVGLPNRPYYLPLSQGFFSAPVIEHDHPDAFITKGMYEYLRNGDFNKVPLIIGFNSEESLSLVDQGLVNSLVSAFDSSPNIIVPLDMHIQDNNALATVAGQIKQIYVPGTTFQSNPNALFTYFSDQSFIRSVIKHAELQSAFTDVFLYEFAYSGTLGQRTSQPVQGFSDNVAHSEELGYLFSRNYPGYDTRDLTKFPEMDQQVFSRMITTFTNFAKTLNPTPQAVDGIIWPKVTANTLEYLAIGSSSEVRSHPKEAMYKAWQSIYDQYGVPPYDTF